MRRLAAAVLLVGFAFFGLLSVSPASAVADGPHQSKAEARKRRCDRFLRYCVEKCNQTIRRLCDRPACYNECNQEYARCLRDADSHDD